MKYDVVIVGGGIAGLTSAAFLSKYGYKTLLLEKQEEVGGLVSSFNYKGFLFDGGIRSIENSGIVHPMVRELKLDVDFIPSTVSLGIEDDVVRVKSEDDVDTFADLLKKKFPNNLEDIDKIFAEVKRIMKYMDVLYAIENPFVFDLKQRKKYIFTDVIPWSIKYLFYNGKINKLTDPVDEYLAKYTDNQALIDVIAQHFFQKTPTFFALSYFSLYLDYYYPRGGTGKIIEEIEKYIINNGGEIRTESPVVKLNTDKNIAYTEDEAFEYDQLIWAADNKLMYNVIDINEVKDSKVVSKIKHMRHFLSDKVGCDSILTVFTTVDIEPSYFKEKCTGHFFYTPVKTGIDHLDVHNHHRLTNKEDLVKLINDYFDNTTYEISIPVLRDETLAPKGKTGLVISTLFDYSLAKRVQEYGWYDELKKLAEQKIIEVLSNSIFPGLEEKVIDRFSATPLTIQNRTGNTDGAIVGWAFTNKENPSVDKITDIKKALNTPIKNIHQAGQWTYSPAGFPISVLTGKLAADKAKKYLKKRKL